MFQVFQIKKKINSRNIFSEFWRHNHSLPKIVCSRTGIAPKIINQNRNRVSVLEKRKEKKNWNQSFEKFRNQIWVFLQEPKNRPTLETSAPLAPPWANTSFRVYTGARWALVNPTCNPPAMQQPWGWPYATSWGMEITKNDLNLLNVIDYMVDSTSCWHLAPFQAATTCKKAIQSRMRKGNLERKEKKHTHTHTNTQMKPRDMKTSQYSIATTREHKQQQQQQLLPW
jgi:hypothetical protein